MRQRSIGEVMAEGQRLTLELVDLKRKEIAGTATAEDKTRIVQLDAYLLGLVAEAQAQGVGVGVGTGYGQTSDSDSEWNDEDEQMAEDFADEDEVSPQPYNGYSPFRY